MVKRLGAILFLNRLDQGIGFRLAQRPQGYSTALIRSRPVALTRPDLRTLAGAITCAVPFPSPCWIPGARAGIGLGERPRARAGVGLCWNSAAGPAAILVLGRRTIAALLSPITIPVAGGECRTRRVGYQ